MSTCRAHPTQTPFSSLNYFPALLARARRYQEYVGRFHSIFRAPSSVPVYYIPGNHDVGLGDRRNTSSLARPRYISTFGPPTQHVKLGGHSLFMIDGPALVDEDLRRENVGEEGNTNGLPQDLKYLQYMRALQVASGYLVRSRLCLIDYSWFIQRHAFDLIHSHSPVPPVRLGLRTAPRERDHPLRARGGLPNVAEPRDLPTSPGRTQPCGHFQVPFF